MLRLIILAVIGLVCTALPASADQMDRSARLPLLQAAKEAQKDSAAYASARQDTERAMACLNSDLAKEPAGKREKKRAQCYLALLKGLTDMETALTGLRADMDAIKGHLETLKEKDWTSAVYSKLQTLQVNLEGVRSRNDLLAGVIKLDPDSLAPSQSEAVTRLFDQEQSLTALLPDLAAKVDQIQEARLAIVDYMDYVTVMSQAMEIKATELDLAKHLTRAVMESRKIQLVLCLVQQDSRCDGTNRTQQLKAFVDDRLLARVSESVGLSKPNTPRVAKVELKNRLAERRK